MLQLISLIKGLFAKRETKAVLFDLGDTLFVEEIADRPENQGKHIWEIEFEKVEGTDELLRTLYGHYKMAIVTNTETSREPQVRIALRKAGIVHFFDVVITSVDVGAPKPEAEIYMKALEALNAKPSEAVMIGNRLEIDILGARKLGIRTILLRRNERYRGTPLTDEEKPDYVVKSLSEIPKILGGLRSC